MWNKDHPGGETPLHEPLLFVKQLINMREEASDGLSETLLRYLGPI